MTAWRSQRSSQLNVGAWRGTTPFLKGTLGSRGLQITRARQCHTYGEVGSVQKYCYSRDDSACQVGTSKLTKSVVCSSSSCGLVRFFVLVPERLPMLRCAEKCLDSNVHTPASLAPCQVAPLKPPSSPSLRSSPPPSTKTAPSPSPFEFFECNEWRSTLFCCKRPSRS